jgi:hypothetical protein
MLFKEIKKRRKASGLKKKRLKKSGPLKTSSPFFPFLLLVMVGI